MVHLSQKEFEQIVSLYLDGELAASEAKKLEEYLASNPSAAREVDVLRTVKKSLQSKDVLPANDWFWLTLSQRIDSIHGKQQRSIFSLRPALAFSSIAVMIMAVTGMIYMKDAPLFHQFFADKKYQAEDLYRNNIMTGDILPLFTNLNKDDILNFALFGSIDIDSSKNTSLQVKHTDEKGSQIQIVRNDARSPQKITLSEFAAEIGINSKQREVVDSILGSYKKTLQASILVSDNDEVAIHAELVELNRAMVSTIAASLELPQRSKFQKYLDIKKAPYTVVALNTPKVPNHVILNKIPQIAATNNYVVISPDTVEIAHMSINVDSIREIANRVEMNPKRIETERLVADLVSRHRPAEENVVGNGVHRVRIQSSAGAFQIHFENALPPNPPEYAVTEMVRPRMNIPYLPNSGFDFVTVTGDSMFSFELPVDDQAARIVRRFPKGEFRFEIIDSLMSKPRVKLMLTSPSGKSNFRGMVRVNPERNADLIDLDSLLKQSDQHIDAVPESPVDSNETEDEEIIL